MIFVDFVDYDEIAHHAGVARPEAVDALAGLDRMLSVLEQLADAADRAYRFVVLSDHGQSQGATFRQLEGRTLEDVVRDLVGAPTGATVSSTVDAESWGPVNALLAAVLSAKRTTPRWAQRRGGEDGAGALVGPQRRQGRAPRSGDGGRPELVVVGSGNLGLVWFPRLPGRVDVEELQQRFPRLLPGVLGRAGVGFVVVDSARGPLAVGESWCPRAGRRSGRGHRSADALRAHGPLGTSCGSATMANAPDLLVHSAIEPQTLQVHAFEELVGCHGGLGGWQNLAVLVHPALWPLDADSARRVRSRGTVAGRSGERAPAVGAVAGTIGDPATNRSTVARAVWGRLRGGGRLMAGRLRLTWLGHSSVLVETGGRRIVADPLLRRHIGALRRASALPEAAAELLRRGVDAAVLSHLHHDHCDLPTLRALRAPVLVVPPGAGAWLVRHGLSGVVELAPGESLDLDGGVRIVATPAEHLGRRAPWGPTAMSVGHLVEGPGGPEGSGGGAGAEDAGGNREGRTAWLAGDTSLFAGMTGLAELSRHGRIDVAAVPVWGWGPSLGPGHLNPDLAAEAVVRVGVRHVIPVHWGTLHPAFLGRMMRTQLRTPGHRFAAALAELDFSVTAEVLPLGGSTSGL